LQSALAGCLGAAISRQAGAHQFEKYLNGDIAKWAKVIRGAGIKVD